MKVLNWFYLSKPETKRNFPSRAQITRAPLKPYGPEPCRMAVRMERGSKMRILPSLHTEAIYNPHGLQATPKTSLKKENEI
jgi:hypothetical protein